MQWKVSDEFLQTCEKNIGLIKDAYHDVRPVKLHSFQDFDRYEDTWWSEYYDYFASEYNGWGPFRGGRIKFNYMVPNTIPVLDALSEHFFSKIYSNHKIVSWLSTEAHDDGSDWHTDLYPKNTGENYECPSYLICMNLVGETHWQFDGYDDIYLKPGDVICQNGSVKHKVKPLNSTQRITLAGHNGLKYVIL